LSDILELEFQISYNKPGEANFDNKDFFEFIWLYERLAAEKQKESEASNSQKTIPLQDSLAQMTGGNSGR